MGLPALRNFCTYSLPYSVSMKGSCSTFFRFGVPDEAPAMAALTASLPSGILRGGGRGGVAGGEAAFCGDATGLQASPDIRHRPEVDLALGGEEVA